MTRPERTIQAARELAQAMPKSVLHRLVDSLLPVPGPTLDEAARLIRAASPASHYQQLATSLVSVWRDEAHELPAAAIGAALLAVDRHQRLADQLSLVWTGPMVTGIPARRTDQALIEVIDAARAELMIVSFVAYRVPRVRDAIARALARGVHVRLIMESPETSDGRVVHDGIQALVNGSGGLAVFVWPRERRPVDDRGRRGSLHAKFAVADDSVLFISSANLTEHALALNIEMGILIKGGNLPGLARDRIAALIRDGELVKLRVE